MWSQTSKKGLIVLYFMYDLGCNLRMKQDTAFSMFVIVQMFRNVILILFFLCVEQVHFLF